MKASPELTERITIYLYGQMSPQETISFEQKMILDPLLHEEVIEQRKLHTYLGKTSVLDFRKHVQEVRTEMLQQETTNAVPKRIFPIWKVAAALVVLIGLGGGVWTYRTTWQDRSTDLYAVYYTPFLVEDEKRGKYQLLRKKP